MIFHLQVGAYAALTCNAILHRYTCKIAVQAVAPLVIRADEDFGIAKLFLAKLGALVCTAVLQNINAAVAITHHDDRLLANHRGLAVTPIWNFAFQRDITPVRFVAKRVELSRMQFDITVNALIDKAQ